MRGWLPLGPKCRLGLPPVPAPSPFGLRACTLHRMQLVDAESVQGCHTGHGCGMTLLPPPPSPFVPFGSGVHPKGKQCVRLQRTLGELLAGSACMRPPACWGAVASRGQMVGPGGGLRAQAMLYCCCIAASRLPWFNIISTSPGPPWCPAPIVSMCSASMASSSQQAQRISRYRACWRCRQGRGWRPLPPKSTGGPCAAAYDDLMQARPCQLHASNNALSPGHANASKGQGS